MKVAILGASGIIGQHLMISVPEGIEAVFTTRNGGPLFTALELTQPEGDAADYLLKWLDTQKPDVVVNLAGENRPDVVEKDPGAYSGVNYYATQVMGSWCAVCNAHYIHISSQAVKDPVNAYGQQKKAAEESLKRFRNWTILRPTFVLGIRPFPAIGRENPAERILAGREECSVYDRSFSISFAWDVAEAIWNAVKAGPSCNVLEIGQPESLSRWDVARMLGANPVRVSHDSLGLAPRPFDTTYTGAWSQVTTLDGIKLLQDQYQTRERDRDRVRAKELAAFLRLPYQTCLRKLLQGFGPLHNAVTEDFKRAFPSGVPPTHDALQNWYKSTEAYLWELTAYHCDPGWKYAQMVGGIIVRLKAAGCKRVLVLGDGTGDVSLAMQAAGLHPTYNDLAGSRIAAFAEARFFMRLGLDWDQKIGVWKSESMEPPMFFDFPYDAVVSLDFLEHVPNVETWVRAVFKMLLPGGLFCAQNAFGMGSGPEGAMPMHLKENDRFEKDWDPLLLEVGFTQESSNWYRKPV